jgi:ketosteroid isomerase-like protein
MTAAIYGQSRIDSLFASIDSGNSEAFVEFLTEDASFRFGSAPALLGRAEIAVGVAAFFKTIAACKHQVARVIVDADTLVCEGEVTYTRHDDSKLTLPFLNVFELTGELINDYKIYIDVSPLFAG